MWCWCVPVGMRSLVLLVALVLAPALRAQPVDAAPIIRPPEPSIGHLYSRSGRPSAPLYYLTDTIEVRLIGYVKLDGSCGSDRPIYGFQRKEGNTWTDYLPPCNVQLCCGMPDRWFQETVALIPAHVARPAYGKPWKPGEYRAVVLLVGDKELIGPPFTVVAGE
ncbi:MAG: hypothetical protein JNL52_14370 [Flavobacteriales bacterium]|nr:hypothetical protein [Flavobacteriales bacterium]